MAIALLAASCASVPEPVSPSSARVRLDGIGETLTAIGEAVVSEDDAMSAGTAGNVEVLLLDLTGEARDPLLELIGLHDRLSRRLDRACFAGESEDGRTTWLEGRFGLLAVSVAMALEGYPRTGDRSWRIPDGEIVHESRGVLRIDLGDATPDRSRRTGRRIFSLWDKGASDIVLALQTDDRSRLPSDLKEAQGPFIPGELLAIAWLAPDGVELALRTTFPEERIARVALVATRLGARRTIERFLLETTSEFAIDRREREIDIIGVVAPWESISAMADIVEGGQW